MLPVSSAPALLLLFATAPISQAKLLTGSLDSRESWAFLDSFDMQIEELIDKVLDWKKGILPEAGPCVTKGARILRRCLCEGRSDVRLRRAR